MPITSPLITIPMLREEIKRLEHEIRFIDKRIKAITELIRVFEQDPSTSSIQHESVGRC